MNTTSSTGTIRPTGTMRTRRQTRRRVLGSTTIAGGLLLAACGAPAPAAEQVNTNPTTGGEIAWWMLTNNQNEPQILQEQVFKDYLWTGHKSSWRSTSSVAGTP